MGVCTTPVNVTAAAKPHRCDWCGEKIDIGQPYKKWRWFDGGDASTTKVHPECDIAMSECDPIDMADGFSVWSNPRGCNCGFDAHCDRCNNKKAKE